MALPPAPSGLPKLFACQWDWCPYSNPDAGRLRAHVMAQHIDTAMPIRKGDLPDILRAEEGVGETLSIGGKMTGLCSKTPTQDEERVSASKPGA